MKTMTSVDYTTDFFRSRPGRSFNGGRALSAAVWLLIASLWNGATNAAEANGTNQPRTLQQRLERTHLEAAHQARLAFERQRVQVLSHGVYEDYRAIVLPPGSEQKRSREELTRAAKKAGVQIVFLIEHDGAGVAARTNEGVLFISGIENEKGTWWLPEFAKDGKPIPNTGLTIFPVDDTSTDMHALVRMEICNETRNQQLRDFLTPISKEPARWQSLVSDYQAYPDEFVGATAGYSREAFAQWDQEGEKRHLTVIAAKVCGVTNLSTDGTLEAQFRSLTTHILAEELTAPLIQQALTNGHAYVAHDWLCDPTGFMFGAVNNLGVFSMGDAAPMQGTTRIMGMTPIPAMLRLFHKGTLIQETTGTNLTFQAKEPGAYRLEAWLTVDGEERRWILSNPVYLKSFGAGDMRLPSSAISSEVTVQKNIVYRDGPEDESAKHKLDVYSPKERTNSPVFFFIHGGAWKSGDRALYPALGNRFARAGFVTVVPSYRLAPKHPHPAQIEDVAAAFAWTIGHVSEFGGDTNRVYVAGHSAGGHLAALLTLDEKRLAEYHLSSKNIHGVLALSGVYNFTRGESQDSVFGTDPEKRRDASPLFHVKGDSPPFLVAYCQWDYFSLPFQAREFYRSLRKAGVNAELAYIPQENHISEMVNISKDDAPLADAVLKFMHR